MTEPTQLLSARNLCRPASAFILSACVAVPAAMAEESTTVRVVDALNPYATVSYAHDSNLFRLPDNLKQLLQEAGSDLSPPPDGRSDQILRYQGGFDWRTRISQQEFLLNGFIFRNDYADYGVIDHTGGQGIGQWNWKLGQSTKGKLGFKYDKRLRSFENQLIPRKDLREEKKSYGEINQGVFSNWVVNLRGSLADITFSESESLDLDRNVFGGGIVYVSRAGNELGFDVEYTDGNFKQSDFKNFDEWDVGATLDWQATSLINVSGKAGWSWRDNKEDETRPDYDDFTARVNFVRKAGTDGNRITASVFRELSNLNDEVANFALIHGVSVEPYWQATGKIGVTFVASYEDRDFKGRGQVLQPDLDSRQDEVYLAGVKADYQLNKVFSFAVEFEAGERNSNRDLEEYDYRTVQASVTAEF